MNLRKKLSYLLLLYLTDSAKQAFIQTYLWTTGRLSQCERPVAAIFIRDTPQQVPEEWWIVNKKSTESYVIICNQRHLADVNDE